MAGRDEEKIDILVAIEGNIGSGKSSFLTKFKEDDFALLEEPVAEWTDVGGHDLLGLKYADSRRWELGFQLHVDITRLNQLRMSEGTKEVRIMERSLLSGHEVFCTLQKPEMHPAEVKILENWHEYQAVGLTTKTVPDLVLYLRTSPEVAHRRMVYRDRTAESGVSLEFITKVHDMHEKVFIGQRIYWPFPVVVLDGDGDVSTHTWLHTKAKEAINRVKAAMVAGTWPDW
jgi:deoxynucleoside kinase